ncbi:cupin domain-containing protein [Arthrobacter glacialis]|uniref:cupin domain-containing protein n=1 Tax=Arthrobacter glacialis TaxID=1664 RepID=UPI000CD3CBC4|nr:cupin domain-containing protein [Arthrobacter glacialis]POH57377.1 cupin domain-containing protein [Arthrobacter glacialis]
MDTTKQAKSFIRQAGTGDRRWFYGGGIHTWLAKAEETGGASLIYSDTMERGKVTPMHIHPETDEALYILSGEILMNLDGVEERLGAGGLVMALRGQPHAFKVLADDTSLLCIQTPGNAQAFYMGASVPLDAGDNASGTVDFDRIRESGKLYGGIVIVGPPPFD